MPTTLFPKCLAVALGTVALMSCAPDNDTPGGPKAAQHPTELVEHGDTRIDPYYWLRERDNPDVIDHLEAENAYTDSVMKHTEGLQAELLAELEGRIQKDDSSVPVRIDDFYYYTRYDTESEYPIYCRKHGTLEATEEVLLDVNVLAAAEGDGDGYFAVRGVSASPDHRLLAFATDTVGRRMYTIRVKELATGELLDDRIPNATGSPAWANDNQTLFYTRQDPETLRSESILRHRLGTSVEQDPVVFHEADETFNAGVWKTKSRQFIVIGSFQTVSSEMQIIDADYPESEPRVFLPRQRDHEYDIDHRGNEFYIRTNYQAENFRLMRAPTDATSIEQWVEVIPHNEDVLIETFELFEDHLVVEERREGLIELRVRRFGDGEEHYIEFDEAVYVAGINGNPTLDSSTLRFSYASMTTPQSVFDYDMNSRERELRKQQVVLGGFDSANYTSHRLWAPSRDGKRIPVSLVHHIDTRADGTAPLLIYGYGSYGSSIDPGFSSNILSLLDRGFVYALAHIRGGQELGREWYEDGKLLHKMNTFTDFTDATEFLVAEGWGAPEKVFARGGSAGGLLIGAVINQRPELYRGVTAHVPFVDVVTTMLDPTIPLTTGEYDEWGNPEEKVFYDYMLSYSPYDQVKAQDYPHMLVTTGLHDSQVQYWEPAKWVARLRDMKTDDHRLILRTEMEAGHGGKSGRFRQLSETALEWAFYLDLANGVQ